MQLFYAPDIVPPEYTLSEEESKHCIRVLRMACGEELHITDGRGNLYRCEIVDDNPKRCRVRVRDTNSEFGKLPYRLTMAVAPTKNNDRFEWFLEKATEIGVAEIIPLATEHSERRTLKPERENKVITAAVKQSLKAYHPRLHEITPLRQVIKQPFDGQKFIAHCDAPRSALGKAFLPHILHKGGDVLVLIGPEGDFSPEEIDLAVRGGFREITLGSQRLRTETRHHILFVAWVHKLHLYNRGLAPHLQNLRGKILEAGIALAVVGQARHTLFEIFRAVLFEFPPDIDAILGRIDRYAVAQRQPTKLLCHFSSSLCNIYYIYFTRSSSIGQVSAHKKSAHQAGRAAVRPIFTFFDIWPGENRLRRFSWDAIQIPVFV